LSPRDVGLELLENSTATGTALVAIILMVGPVSGAHLNPAITLVDRALHGITTLQAGVYVAAQLLGAVIGAAVANLMFSLPLVEFSTKSRAGVGLLIAESVATAGLVLVVFGVVRSRRPAAAPIAVGAYITAAYWFTASTSFANPAVTFGRTVTNTFAGIAPMSAPAFIAMQLVGAAVGGFLVKLLYPDIEDLARDVVVPPTTKSTAERL
jgi:arsenate reductase